MVAQAESGDVLHVDCVNGSDTNDGSSTADAFATLAKGISQANADAGPQTLAIAPGVCTTGSTVPDITGDLTVTGAGSDTGGTIIDASGLDAGHAAFPAGTFISPTTGISVVVSDLTIDGSGSTDSTAVQYAGDADLTVDDVTIRDISIGVSAAASASGVVSVTGSSFERIGTGTGFINGAAVNVMLSDDANATVSGNTMGENPYGGVYLTMADDTSATVTENAVTGDVTGGDWGPYGGIEVHSGSQSAAQVTVADNMVQSVDGHGILVDFGDWNETGNASEATVSGNLVDTNTEEGFDITTAGTARVTMTANTAQNNAKDGFDLEPAGNSTIALSDNTTRDNVDDGIDIDSTGAAAVTIERDTANDNGSRGLSVGYDQGAHGSVDVVNATFSANASSQVRAKADAGSTGTLSLRFATLTAGAGEGTGLDVAGVSDVAVSTSILDAGESSGLTISAEANVVMDHTLVRTASTDIVDFYSEAGTNIFDEDPLLGPLTTDNGGLTATHLPADDSPVVDAGVEQYAGAPATDQRGMPRFGSPSDLGSVEVVHDDVPPSDTSVPDTVPDTSVPTDTVPVTSSPPVTVPDTSVPGGTTPAATTPGGATGPASLSRTPGSDVGHDARPSSHGALPATGLSLGTALGGLALVLTGLALVVAERRRSPG